ncbi:MAG: phage holin family protein [Reichenbachiella sp.]
MADLFNINKLKETLSDYVKVKLELFKLEITEHVSNILAQVVAYVVILLIATLVLLFLSMGLGFLFNYLLGSEFWGFIIVAGFYLILLIIVLTFLNSGKLKAFIEEAILSTKQQETDEEQ